MSKFVTKKSLITVAAIAAIAVVGIALKADPEAVIKAIATTAAAFAVGQGVADGLSNGYTSTAHQRDD